MTDPSPKNRVITMPTTADEAEAMEKLGFAWLKEHAPERLTAEGLARPIPDASHHTPCPCTLIEQDEDCPVGYPSMICGVCKGTGNTTPEQVTALACEMIKIASDVGEPDDPFAAWETISLIESQRASFRKALDKIAGMIDDEHADFDDAIDTATHALVVAKAEASDA